MSGPKLLLFLLLSFKFQHFLDVVASFRPKLVGVVDWIALLEVAQAALDGGS